ncbi:oxidoreductase FAD/NADP-binding domain containing protein [Nitzschia inconspicua]|uniref:Oxidoreductase FAD/NADP-binding domain containing protein n=1 Tax=Nitzschia inconspicua TaxID=303405 RepID=A0A9K3KNF0_9STRA|nr:oxidoreductase FAD/NADP-binding domain containing protein [Nitzschia inconspicua]
MTSLIMIRNFVLGLVPSLLLLVYLPAIDGFLTLVSSGHPQFHNLVPYVQWQQLTISSALGATSNGEESWNDATVLSAEAACSSGKSVLWKVQVEKGVNYTVPGQFLQLRKDDTTEPLFLAMCSPPNMNGTLEFLVKLTPNIPWLTDVKADTKVQVSNVMGRGFEAATEALQNNDKEADDGIDHMLLVATGSGVAPIMAAFRAPGWMDRVTYGSMYYGEWTVDDLCFQDELATEEAGINLVPCFSKQERDFTKGFWAGHVQMVMWQRGIVNPEKTLALVCGKKEMEEDVRQLLTRAGVKPERIVTNT